MAALQVVNGLTVLFGILSLFLPFWIVFTVNIGDFSETISFGLMFNSGDAGDLGDIQFPIGTGPVVLAWMALIGACAMTYLASQENYTSGMLVSIFVTLTSLLTWAIYIATDFADAKDLIEILCGVNPQCEATALGFVSIQGGSAVLAHAGFFCAVLMTASSIASIVLFNSAKSEQRPTQVVSKV